MKPENVTCPTCNGPMVSLKRGEFWGCRNYPRCHGTRNRNGEVHRDTFTVAESHDLSPSERQGRNDRRRY